MVMVVVRELLRELEARMVVGGADPVDHCPAQPAGPTKNNPR
jgi:hypothetical protein